MEVDKRPVYNWIMVLLVNIGTIMFMVFYDLSYIALGMSVFLSVVPILISKSNSRLKNRFGYGIPVFLLLVLIYSIYDYNTCTGKFCQLGAVVLGWVSGLSAVIFAVFYTVGVYSKKWNSKFVLFLSIMIPILIMGGLWLLVK